MTPLNIRLLNTEEMMPGNKNVSLILTVTAGGNLVDDANITVEGDSPGYVDEQEGEQVYVVKEVMAGQITIKASKEGFEDGKLTIKVPESEDIPDKPPLDEPSEEEPPEEEPEEEEPPEPESVLPSTPICDAIFFSGQKGYPTSQGTVNALKAELLDLEGSTDPFAEDKIEVGKEAIALIEADLQETAKRDAEIASAKKKADEADAKADEAGAMLKSLLEQMKKRTGGVYFV